MHSKLLQYIGQFSLNQAERTKRHWSFDMSPQVVKIKRRKTVVKLIYPAVKTKTLSLEENYVKYFKKGKLKKLKHLKLIKM